MVLFLDWLMSMEPAPLSNHPESPAQAIPCGLASHHPEAGPTRANPVMSETQQVEKYLVVLLPLFPTVGLVRWMTKTAPAVSCRMQVILKTFGQHLQNPPGTSSQAKSFCTALIPCCYDAACDGLVAVVDQPTYNLQIRSL